MGDQVKIQMKTTVFITRRGKSFAIAKVISLAARFSTNKVSRDAKPGIWRAFRKSGEFQSGQMGQTVNLLSLDFGGSNPSSPTRQAYGDAGKPVPAVLPRNHLII